MKNILICGSPRVGKTTLAKKISNELGYIYIGLDNIFESIEKLPCWPYPKYHDASIISSELSNFVINFINNLDKDKYYVFEGAYLDIESIYNKLNNTIIIGLTYNNLSSKKLFDRIKKYDKNEWINSFDDKTLLDKCDCFINRNKYYNNCFLKLDIKNYDLSNERDIVFNNIINELKKEYIGNEFEIIIDRKKGSHHPKYPDMIYPINYGYLPNTRSNDNEEIDCYLLGVDKPVERYKGVCIAIIKRIDDNDDKLIMVPKGVNYNNSEIEELIYFQEKYFNHTIIR
jgi:inorganic pyrophosphatase